MAEKGETVSSGVGCMVEEGADVSQSILWDNVHIKIGARVRRAVLGDNVRIPAGAVIEDAVIVPRSLVEGHEPPAKALKGAFIGDNFVVPLAQ